MSDRFRHQLSIGNEIGLFSEISTWTQSQATVFVTVSSVFLHSADVYLLPPFLTTPLCTLKCSVLTALSIGTWSVCWNLKTWLSVSSVVLHAGDTARLSERCFSAICSGSRNRRIRHSSHDRLRIQRLRGLASLAFVALLLVFVVLSIGALVCVKRLEPPASASVFTCAGKTRHMLSVNCLRSSLFCHPRYHNGVLTTEGDPALHPGFELFEVCRRENGQFDTQHRTTSS